MKMRPVAPISTEAVIGSEVGIAGEHETGRYLYHSVHDLLAEKIRSGALPAGTLIKETHLSAQFGMSRAPVRRALSILADNGMIRAADGQGYIVGRAARPQVRMTSRQLHKILARDLMEIDRSAAWKRIFSHVANEVSSCMPFGNYRILEAELGDYYKVSRTVAREVLWHLMDRHLIEKDRKSHWIVGQLTARDLRETLEMRRLLEPQALANIVSTLNLDWLEQLHKRVATAVACFPACGADEINIIDEMMFHDMYNGLRNKRMLDSIRRSHNSLLVQHLFRLHFSIIDDLPALQNHDRILRNLLNGDLEPAQTLLRQHLTQIEPLTVARLRVLSLLPPPQMAYLTPLS